MIGPIGLQAGVCTIGQVSTHLAVWFQTLACQDFSTDPRIFIEYFRKFRQDLLLVAEFPYTDKVYRDSYYNYHSGKYREVSRDCMRVFLFDPDVQITSVPPNVSTEVLKKHFLGYVVLRPLARRPFGRAMISPRALDGQTFVTCLSNSSCSFFGHKLRVAAFPHESQDAETHSCAETAIWSIFEYYGNQYAEHRPVLPSAITSALQVGAARRLLPSKGLTILEIGRALQHLGHGTQTYSAEALGEGRFHQLLHYMVESGIPVIGGLGGKDQTEGHAIVITGHSEKAPTWPSKGGQTVNRVEFFDTANLPHRLVSIDDNLSPYALIDPKHPGEFYSKPSRQSCKLTHFVVPLHRHMLMDVLGAAELMQHVLTHQRIGVSHFPGVKACMKRIFLTGGRSFKDWLLREPHIDAIVKKIVLTTHLPRFVWVCELSTPDAFSQSMAEGFLLIDATGATDLDSLLHYFFRGSILRIEAGGTWRWQSTATRMFWPYRNNLKGHWSQWEIG